MKTALERVLELETDKDELKKRIRQLEEHLEIMRVFIVDKWTGPKHDKEYQKTIHPRIGGGETIPEYLERITK